MRHRRSGGTTSSTSTFRYAFEATCRRLTGRYLRFNVFMTGQKVPAPAATSIVLHERSCVLEIAFADGRSFRIPAELMRVYSPSAEVKGHGPGQEVLQTGKRGVGISGVEAVGNYGIKPVFTDGHDTGIFTWEFLYHLGSRQQQLWADYEARLAKAGASRDQPMQEASPRACGH